MLRRSVQLPVNCPSPIKLEIFLHTLQDYFRYYFRDHREYTNTPAIVPFKMGPLFRILNDQPLYLPLGKISDPQDFRINGSSKTLKPSDFTLSPFLSGSSS